MLEICLFADLLFAAIATIGAFILTRTGPFNLPGIFPAGIGTLAISSALYLTYYVVGCILALTCKKHAKNQT